MRKLSTYLKTFLAAMLLLVGSTAWAERFYHVEMVPVLENGATGFVYATPNGSAYTKYYNYLYNNGKENKWTTHFNGTFSLEKR